MSAWTESCNDATLAIPPAGSDPAVVRRWSLGLDPLSHPLVGSLTPTNLTAMSWWHLVATESFWDEDGPGSLTNGFTAALSALWSLQHRLAIVVRGTTAGLHYDIGIAGPLGPVAPQVLGAHLPGMSLRSVDISGRSPSGTPDDARLFATLTGPPDAFVAGRPADRAAPPATPIVEQLAALDRPGWMLAQILEPVALPVTAERLERLFVLEQSFADHTQRQHRIDDVSQAVVTDRAIETAASLVKAERAHTEMAAAIGGFITATWIRAVDPATTASVIGVLNAANARTPEEDGSTNESPRLRPLPLRAWPAVSDNGLPGTFAHTRDVAGLLQPPMHDMRGLPARPWARFDLHVAPAPSGAAISIGQTAGGDDLGLSLDALVRHTAIFGLPGYGKSTFVFRLLRALAEARVPFCVFEPTKTEYTRLSVPGLRVWKVGSPIDDGWRWNPFHVPTGVPVSTHIGNLAACLATLDLVSPLDSVARIALDEIYAARGWNTTTSTNPWLDTDRPVFPTWHEFVDACSAIVSESAKYSRDVKADLLGAIDTRLRPIGLGSLGRDLSGDRGLDPTALLTMSLVVNTDMVGDDRTRSFVSALVLVAIGEALRVAPSEALRFVLVVEEAHRLLGSSGAEQATAAATVTPRAYLAGTVVNLLAEVRGLCCGAVVIDQRPADLDRAVLALTGTLVSCRIKEENDQQALAAAMSLDDSQRRALTMLECHEAVIFRDGDDRPMRVRLHHEFLAPIPDDPTPAPHADLRHTVAPTPDMTAISARLVRSTGAASRAARRELGELVRRRLPRESDSAITERTTVALVSDAIESLGQARGWSLATRDRAVSLALAGEDHPSHPFRLLLTGDVPLDSCSLVCPAQGCLMREVARPLARRIATDRRFEAAQMPAHPVVLRGLLQRGATSALGRIDGGGADESDELALLYQACAVVQALDADHARPTVKAVLDAVMELP